MISLRLSDQEYRELKDRCAVTGDINVSEFVRAATLHALALPELIALPSYLEVQFATLLNRLNKLEQRIAETASQGSEFSGAQD